MPTHCCDQMDSLLNRGQTAIAYNEILREYSILDQHLASTARQEMIFCPWCGKRLPASLRDEWFEVMEREFGIDDPNSSPPGPQEMHTDAWWRKRRL
jgi:hypothetical protein